MTRASQLDYGTHYCRFGLGRPMPGCGADQHKQCQAIAPGALCGPVLSRRFAKCLQPEPPEDLKMAEQLLLDAGPIRRQRSQCREQVHELGKGSRDRG